MTMKESMAKTRSQYWSLEWNLVVIYEKLHKILLHHILSAKRIITKKQQARSSLTFMSFLCMILNYKNVYNFAI